MAVRNILEIGDEALRQDCKSVTKFNAHLHKTLNDMADTMKKAEGVGLAAPQVGILRRICIVDILDGSGLHEFINPEILEQEGSVQGQEGCLSVPGRLGLVSRPQRILVKALDRQGNEFEMEATDFLARAICHEMDHLEGRLYVDIMDNELFKEDIEAMEENKKRVYRRASSIKAQEE